ncbi:MAG: methionine--tRNA ligase [Planctomycetota bacterium]
MTRYLVTSALPYANGPIHFGHVIGAYLPADVYVRTLRMMGEEVRFICGTDEHGVAITFNAEQQGIAYPEYVARWREEIKFTFDRFGIEFDGWSGTSICPHHAEMSREFFRRLAARGYLTRQTSEQLFCATDDMFLADRYVVGTCDHCGHREARGDECPACGTWLDPLRMIDTRCKICGAPPVRRLTTHWYIDLPRLRDEHIGKWFAAHPWKGNVKALIGRMLEELRPRPITRDLKWGVPVPEEIAGEERGKVLYVWFDAPIGYISFTRELAEAEGDPAGWRRYWQDPDTRLVHFIGKDNIPFHCLIFPAMLWGVGDGFVLPWKVPAMEFYNLQGRKFSTSQGWSIPLDDFFARYDGDAARFYLLASAPENADSEWRWDEFRRCVNSALADTIGNLVTRVLRFAAQHFDGRVPPLSPAHAEELDRILLTECGPIVDPGEHLLEPRFRLAAEALVGNATVGNVFVDRLAPWALRRSDPARAASVLNTACEWISWLARWMAPFMPGKAQAIWEMLGGAGAVSACRWPGTPRRGGWRSLGEQPLGTVEPPFAKLPENLGEPPDGGQDPPP